MNVAAGPHQALKQRAGCGRLMAFGCMGFVVVLIIAAAVIYFNYRSLTAWRVEYLIDESLSYSKMDDQKKDAIREQVGRVLTAFEEETVSDEQLKDLVSELTNHPLVPALVSIVVMVDIVPNVDLTSEEQDSLAKELSRMTLAFEQGKLDAKAYQAVIEELMVKDEEGEYVPGLKGDASKQELLSVRDKAKTRADELGIPDAPYQYDFEAGLEAYVNQALGAEEL